MSEVTLTGKTMYAVNEKDWQAKASGDSVYVQGWSEMFTIDNDAFKTLNEAVSLINVLRTEKYNDITELIIASDVSYSGTYPGWGGTDYVMLFRKDMTFSVSRTVSQEHADVHHVLSIDNSSVDFVIGGTGSDPENAITITFDEFLDIETTGTKGVWFGYVYDEAGDWYGYKAANFVLNGNLHLEDGQAHVFGFGTTFTISDTATVKIDKQDLQTCGTTIVVKGNSNFTDAQVTMNHLNIEALRGMTINEQVYAASSGVWNVSDSYINLTGAGLGLNSATDNRGAEQTGKSAEMNLTNSLLTAPSFTAAAGGVLSLVNSTASFTENGSVDGAYSADGTAGRYDNVAGKISLAQNSELEIGGTLTNAGLVEAATSSLTASSISNSGTFSFTGESTLTVNGNLTNTGDINLEYAVSQDKTQPTPACLTVTGELNNTGNININITGFSASLIDNYKKIAEINTKAAGSFAITVTGVEETNYVIDPDNGSVFLLGDNTWAETYVVGITGSTFGEEIKVGGTTYLYHINAFETLTMAFENAKSNTKRIVIQGDSSNKLVENSLIAPIVNLKHDMELVAVDGSSVTVEWNVANRAESTDKDTLAQFLSDSTTSHSLTFDASVDFRMVAASGYTGSCLYVGSYRSGALNPAEIVVSNDLSTDQIYIAYGGTMTVNQGGTIESSGATSGALMIHGAGNSGNTASADAGTLGGLYVTGTGAENTPQVNVGSYLSVFGSTAYFKDTKVAVDGDVNMYPYNDRTDLTRELAISGSEFTAGGRLNLRDKALVNISNSTASFGSVNMTTGTSEGEDTGVDGGTINVAGSELNIAGAFENKGVVNAASSSKITAASFNNSGTAASLVLTGSTLNSGTGSITNDGNITASASVVSASSLSNSGVIVFNYTMGEDVCLTVTGTVTNTKDITINVSGFDTYEFTTDRVELANLNGYTAGSNEIVVTGVSNSNVFVNPDNGSIFLAKYDTNTYYVDADACEGKNYGDVVTIVTIDGSTTCYYQINAWGSLSDALLNMKSNTADIKVNGDLTETVTAPFVSLDHDVTVSALSDAVNVTWTVTGQIGEEREKPLAHFYSSDTTGENTYGITFANNVNFTLANDGSYNGDVLYIASYSSGTLAKTEFTVNNALTSPQIYISYGGTMTVGSTGTVSSSGALMIHGAGNGTSSASLDAGTLGGLYVTGTGAETEPQVNVGSYLSVWGATASFKDTKVEVTGAVNMYPHRDRADLTRELAISGSEFKAGGRLNLRDNALVNITDNSHATFSSVNMTKDPSVPEAEGSGVDGGTINVTGSELKITGAFENKGVVNASSSATIAAASFNNNDATASVVLADSALSVTDSLENAGSMTATASTIDIASLNNGTAASIALTGSTLTVNGAIANEGSVTGSASTVSAASLNNGTAASIALTGSELKITNAIENEGSITASTISAASLSNGTAASIALAGSTLTIISGTVTNEGSITDTSSSVIDAVSLDNSGTISLGNLSKLAVSGTISNTGSISVAYVSGTAITVGGLLTNTGSITINVDSSFEGSAMAVSMNGYADVENAKEIVVTGIDEKFVFRDTASGSIFLSKDEQRAVTYVVDAAYGTYSFGESVPSGGTTYYYGINAFAKFTDALSAVKSNTKTIYVNSDITESGIASQAYALPNNITVSTMKNDDVAITLNVSSLTEGHDVNTLVQFLSDSTTTRTLTFDNNVNFTVAKDAQAVSAFEGSCLYLGSVASGTKAPLTLVVNNDIVADQIYISYGGKMTVNTTGTIETSKALMIHGAGNGNKPETTADAGTLGGLYVTGTGAETEPQVKVGSYLSIWGATASFTSTKVEVTEDVYMYPYNDRADLTRKLVISGSEFKAGGTLNLRDNSIVDINSNSNVISDVTFGAIDMNVATATTDAGTAGVSGGTISVKGKSALTVNGAMNITAKGVLNVTNASLKYGLDGSTSTNAGTIRLTSGANIVSNGTLVNSGSVTVNRVTFSSETSTAIIKNVGTSASVDFKGEINGKADLSGDGFEFNAVNVTKSCVLGGDATVSLTGTNKIYGELSGNELNFSAKKATHTITGKVNASEKLVQATGNTILLKTGGILSAQNDNGTSVMLAQGVISSDKSEINGDFINFDGATVSVATASKLLANTVTTSEKAVLSVTDGSSVKITKEFTANGKVTVTGSEFAVERTAVQRGDFNYYASKALTVTDSSVIAACFNLGGTAASNAVFKNSSLDLTNDLNITEGSTATFTGSDLLYVGRQVNQSGTLSVNGNTVYAKYFTALEGSKTTITSPLTEFGALYIENNAAVTLKDTKLELTDGETWMWTSTGNFMNKGSVVLEGDSYLLANGNFMNSGDITVKVLNDASTPRLSFGNAYSNTGTITIDFKDATADRHYLFDNTGDTVMSLDKYNVTVKNMDRADKEYILAVGYGANDKGDLFALNMTAYSKVVSVNQTWSGLGEGTEVEEGSVIGFNAYADYNNAISWIADRKAAGKTVSTFNVKDVETMSLDKGTLFSDIDIIGQDGSVINFTNGTAGAQSYKSIASIDTLNVNGVDVDVDSYTLAGTQSFKSTIEDGSLTLADGTQNLAVSKLTLDINNNGKFSAGAIAVSGNDSEINLSGTGIEFTADVAFNNGTNNKFIVESNAEAKFDGNITDVNIIELKDNAKLTGEIVGNNLSAIDSISFGQNVTFDGSLTADTVTLNSNDTVGSVFGRSDVNHDSDFSADQDKINGGITKFAHFNMSASSVTGDVYENGAGTIGQSAQNMGITASAIDGAFRDNSLQLLEFSTTTYPGSEKQIETAYLGAEIAIDTTTIVGNVYSNAAKSIEISNSTVGAVMNNNGLDSTAHTEIFANPMDFNPRRTEEISDSGSLSLTDTLVSGNVQGNQFSYIGINNSMINGSLLDNGFRQSTDLVTENGTVTTNNISGSTVDISGSKIFGVVSGNMISSLNISDSSTITGAITGNIGKERTAVDGSTSASIVIADSTVGAISGNSGFEFILTNSTVGAISGNSGSEFVLTNSTIDSISQIDSDAFIGNAVVVNNSVLLNSATVGSNVKVNNDFTLSSVELSASGDSALAVGGKYIVNSVTITDDFSQLTTASDPVIIIDGSQSGNSINTIIYDNNTYTLGVVGEKGYKFEINSANDLVVSVTASGSLYVNSNWNGKSASEPIELSCGTVYYKYNAFDTYDNIDSDKLEKTSVVTFVENNATINASALNTSKAFNTLDDAAITVTFSNDLTAAADTVISFSDKITLAAKALTVNGKLTLNGTASVDGNLNVTDTLVANDAASVTGTVTNSGTLTAAKTLNSGAVTNSGTLTVNGAAAISGDLVNNDTLTANDAASVTGSLTNSGTLTAAKELNSGAVTNSGTLTVNGTASIDGDLSNTGTFTANDTMTVSGNLTNDGTFNLKNLTVKDFSNSADHIVNLSGKVTVSDSFSNEGTITVDVANITNSPFFTFGNYGLTTGDIFFDAHKFTGVVRLIDYTGSNEMDDAEYQSIVGAGWDSNMMINDNDLWLAKTDNSSLLVNIDWGNTCSFAEDVTGASAGVNFYGVNAFKSVKDAFESDKWGNTNIVKLVNANEDSAISLSGTSGRIYAITGATEGIRMDGGSVSSFTLNDAASLIIYDVEMENSSIDVKTGSKLSIDDATINANNITVDNGAATVTDSVLNTANFNVNADGVADISNSTVASSDVTVSGKLAVANSKLNVSNIVSVNGSESVEIKNSTVSAVSANFEASTAAITGSEFNANGMQIINNSNVKFDKSEIAFTGIAGITSSKAEFKSSSLTADNFNATASTVIFDDVNFNAVSDFSGSDVTMKNSTVSKTVAFGNSTAAISGSIFSDDMSASAENVKLSFSGTNSIQNLVGDDGVSADITGKLTASDITLQSVSVNDAILSAANFAVSGSATIGDSTVTTTGVISLGSASVSESSVTAANFSVSGTATISDSTVTTTGDITLGSASVSESSVTAANITVSGAATISDSTVTGASASISGIATVSDTTLTVESLALSAGAAITDSTITVTGASELTGAVTVSGTAFSASSITLKDATTVKLDIASDTLVTFSGSISIGEGSKFEADVTGCTVAGQVYKIMDYTGSDAKDLAYYNSIFNNALDEQHFAVLNNDLYYVAGGFGDSTFYVDKAWADKTEGDSIIITVPGTTASKIVFYGLDAFSGVSAALDKAKSTTAIDILGGTYAGRVAFNKHVSAIENGVYNGNVIASTSMFVSSGDTWFVEEGDIQMTINGGTFGTDNSAVVCGADLVQRDESVSGCYAKHVGDITMTVTGGVFNNNIAGGMYYYEQEKVTNAQILMDGDITMNISGGTFNYQIFGGNYLSDSGSVTIDTFNSLMMTVSGDVEIVVNAGNDKIDINENIFAGSYGAGAIGGNTKVEFKGSGSKLDFTATVSGASRYAYYFEELGIEMSYVAGTKTLSFSGFTGNFDAKFTMFDTFSCKNGSDVNFTNGTSKVKEIATWEFDASSNISGIAEIDFTGDKFNFDTEGFGIGEHELITDVATDLSKLDSVTFGTLAGELSGDVWFAEADGYRYELAVDGDSDVVVKKSAIA